MKNLLAHLHEFLSSVPSESNGADNIPRSESVEPTAVEIQRFQLEVDRMQGHRLVTSIEKGAGNELLVIMSNRWQPNPYDLRIQAATGMWRMWATIHAPDDPDRAHIKFVDEQGNWVGGSGKKGSQIEVTRDG